MDLRDDLDAGAIGRPSSDPKAAERPVSSAGHGSVSDARLEGFIVAQLNHIAAAQDGHKHETLLRHAKAIGGVIDQAGLSVSDAWDRIRDALPGTVKDWKQAEKTARYALETGRAEPIELEDRPRRMLGMLWPWASPPDEPEEEEAEEDEPEPEPEPVPAPDPREALIDALDANAWIEADIPPPDRLMGDFLTTTTRAFLVGKTGLGKTMLGVGLAVALASGTDFLHWKTTRAARVLYIDGEMPAELIRQRVTDAVRRAGVALRRGNLIIHGADRGEALLGAMPPLNTRAGHNWIMALVEAIGGVDVVIFDNVM